MSPVQGRYLGYEKPFENNEPEPEKPQGYCPSWSEAHTPEGNKQGYCLILNKYVNCQADLNQCER